MVTFWLRFRRWIHGLPQVGRFWWQRRTRGWDDSDMWSLDFTIAKLILPRLKLFRECHAGAPGCLMVNPDGSEKSIREGVKAWENILDKMIFAFEIYASEERWAMDHDDPNWSRARHGFELFCKYFNCLWS